MTNVLKRAIEDLLDGTRLPVGEAMERHVAPTFRQRVGGRWVDRVSFSARVAAMRKVARDVTITVLDEMIDDARYAERHLIELVQHDGERIRNEVYGFAERDEDRRFLRIDEVTVPVGP